MTLPKFDRTWPSAVLITAVLVGTSACGSRTSGGHDEAAASTGSPAPAGTESPTPAIQDDQAAEVAYEPAYPEDVSEAGLTETDEAQQETHSHGGEHSHGSTHSHDGDEEDGHDGGEHFHGP